MELICDYMRDEKSRRALNELTRKTFWFDFEGWVTGGFYEGDYIPYSFIEKGKIIANVSANRMTFEQNGVVKNYIQLGTVMTDEAFRGQGLASWLIKHVVARYENECDGIYLFGNLDAAGFYRKLDFKEGCQYSYRVKDEYLSLGKAGAAFRPVDAADSEMKKRYQDAVRKSAVNSSFEQINKYGLQLFYTAGMENVFYAEDIDCFIVAEREGEGLFLKSVICGRKAGLADILKRIGGDIKACRLGYTPLPEDMEMCHAERFDGGDDYRFFYRGDELESVERDRLFFPALSHA
ncbi:MAG: GNAT family N-acetyltransferase [Clostridia bacterium]|nr:GNAT family N-acetyltransferase [Clostridia bacterium]